MFGISEKKHRRSRLDDDELGLLDIHEEMATIKENNTTEHIHIVTTLTKLEASFEHFTKRFDRHESDEESNRKALGEALDKLNETIERMNNRWWTVAMSVMGLLGSFCVWLIMNSDKLDIFKNP